MQGRGQRRGGSGAPSGQRMLRSEDDVSDLGFPFFSPFQRTGDMFVNAYTPLSTKMSYLEK
jgi:hypothetical protein